MAKAVTMTTRAYFKLVYEAMGHYHQDEHGWYRVSDGSAKHDPSPPASAEGAEGATREPNDPLDDIPF